jgi:hypothetical protein
MKNCLVVAVLAMFLHGCFSDPESARGFRLPDGDSERGLQAFEDLQCYACHSMPGHEFPTEGASPVIVTLGGGVTRVKTYGELVTSIINPSHKLAPGYRPEEVTRDGESLMVSAALNDVVTVRQLVDLVTFLQPLYEVTPPAYNPYGYTYPSYY